MTMTLTTTNLALVNRMRIAAQKSAEDVDILKFFADRDYARACLTRLVTSGVPEVSAAAVRASLALMPGVVPAPAGAATRAGAGDKVPAAAEARRRPAADPCVATVRTLMRRAAIDAAGFRALLFVRKLDRVQDRDGLLALAEPFHALLTRHVGETLAFGLSQRVIRQLALEP